MGTGLFYKTVVVAALAGGLVWALTIAVFEPAAYVDNRPYCSGFGTIPYELNGVRVEPTLQPHCRFGPVPADALAPSPVPAVATFTLVAALGLLLMAVPGRPKR